eukprot:Awhi_evm1s14580
MYIVGYWQVDNSGPCTYPSQCVHPVSAASAFCDTVVTSTCLVNFKRCKNDQVIERCTSLGSSGTAFVDVPCGSGEICVSDNMGQATCVPECPDPVCQNRAPGYDCPATENDLRNDPRHWCLKSGDSGAFDHVGTCYREIASVAGPGQQSCYDSMSGRDTCTGSWDSHAPYIWEAGMSEVTQATPGATCPWFPDSDEACLHCRFDVLPFCAAHCKVLDNNGIGAWEYEDCGGIIEQPRVDCSVVPAGGCARHPSPEQVWSSGDCKCGNGAITVTGLVCTATSDYPPATGVDPP